MWQTPLSRERAQQAGRSAVAQTKDTETLLGSSVWPSYARSRLRGLSGLCARSPAQSERASSGRSQSTIRRCLARTDFLSVGEWLVAGVLAPALAGQRPRHQPERSAPAPNKMNSHDHFFARAFWSCHNNIEGQGQKPFQGCTKKASGYAPSAKECGRWARERRVPCDEAAVDAGGEAAALARYLTADQRIRCRAS